MFAVDDVPRDPISLVAPSTQFWVMAIGALVPLVTYVLNYHAPWLSQQVKFAVLLALSTAVGVLTTCLIGGNWEWDSTHFQLVASSVVAALAAHYGYKIGDVNVALGGGRNVQQERAAPDG